MLTYLQNLIKLTCGDFSLSPRLAVYGEAPNSCVSCFPQCYAEPSLMQARSIEYLRERWRGNDVGAYSPG